MPVATSYPGVYIEELPSGQQSIVPAATSITAFVGRALQGPVDQPMRITCFGDFQSLYGGLSSKYPLGYAVWDYFENGGSIAIIVRLFEPNSIVDAGVAQLPFPVSPPAPPDGWMLASVPAPGATVINIVEPTGGTEGEPSLGMTLTVGSDNTSYTVIAYTPPTATAPATIAITPPLVNGPNYCECWELNFKAPGDPAGWTIATNSTPKSLVFSGGTGIPQLGDQFTFAADATNTVYTLMANPKVSADTSGNVTVTVGAYSPAMAGTFAPGSGVNFTDPVAAPMPLGWEVNKYTTPTGGTGTLNIVNGQGNPMPFDRFTAGSDNVYLVQSFTPADPKKNPYASIVYGPAAASQPWPPPTGDFGRCQELEFNTRVPQGYGFKPSVKIGDTSITFIPQSPVAPIVVGDMFTIQGDRTVYVVRTYNPTTYVAQFLPAAATVFSGSMKMSLQLTLQAANPGAWGCNLVASVDTTGITLRTVAAPALTSYGLVQDDLFNLTLTLQSPTGQALMTERYVNVTVRTDGIAGNYPNRLDKVLAAQSMLASIDESALPLLPPASGTSAKGVGGNDGKNLRAQTFLGDPDEQTGIYTLEGQDFDMLCIPPDLRLTAKVPLAEQDLDPLIRQAAAMYCTDRRAIYIADPPAIWASKVTQGLTDTLSPSDLGIEGTNSAGIEIERNVAVYFPRIYKEDILANGLKSLFPACGAIAGAIAANDVSRGVWKAPAGVDVGLAGVTGLEVNLTDTHSGILNPLGINCLRTFPLAGTVIWGARTLRGADLFEDDYKYLSVRRLTLFIESSLYQSTQWAVFEPNDEALWSSLRLSVGSFLADLSKQGAFYNYAVRCDSKTTSVTDIQNGRVNILVQIAPVDPAEFIMIQIQQVAPQLSS